MFASRWPKDLGFGANWLFNCEIVRASSKNPEGPYTFQEVVLGRRGRTFFDGMNVHNPYIRKWNQTYYLYYMGTTFGGPIPGPGDEVDSSRFTEVWNRKRIGLADFSQRLLPLGLHCNDQSCRRDPARRHDLHALQIAFLRRRSIKNRCRKSAPPGWSL